MGGDGKTAMLVTLMRVIVVVLVLPWWVQEPAGCHDGVECLAHKEDVQEMVSGYR